MHRRIIMCVPTFSISKQGVASLDDMIVNSNIQNTCTYPPYDRARHIYECPCRLDFPISILVNSGFHAIPTNQFKDRILTSPLYTDASWVIIQMKSGSSQLKMAHLSALRAAFVNSSLMNQALNSRLRRIDTCCISAQAVLGYVTFHLLSRPSL
jgi:hypothetical protein